MSDALDTLRKTLPQAKQGSWYSIKNQAEKATIRIYDEISYWGVSAADFAADLAEITAPAIEVQISSPGGDVFDGIAIYNALRAHPATVTTRVDGLAASAASVIVQAGDQRIMLSGSQMMIHEAWGLAVGSADEMREYADLLDRQSDVLASIYASRSGRDADEFRSLMAVDTWLTDKEAVDTGLADTVIDNPQDGLRVPQSLFVAKAMATLPPDKIAAAEPRTPTPEVTTMADDAITQEAYDALVAERDSLTAQVDALRAEITDLKPEASRTDVDITSLPEPVQAALRDADALKARVAKMEADQRTEAFAKKAAEFAAVAPVAELAPVLEVLDRVAPDQAKALDQCLKAATARLTDTDILTRELGSDGEANGNSEAERLIQAEIAAGTSRPDAIRKVFSARPDLYPVTLGPAE